MSYRFSVLFVVFAFLPLSSFPSNVFADSTSPKLTVTAGADQTVQIKISLDRKSQKGAQYIELERAIQGSSEFSSIARIAKPKRTEIFIDRPAGEPYQYRANLVSRGKKTARSKVQGANKSKARNQAQVATASSSSSRPHPQGQIAYLLITFRDLPQPYFTPSEAAANLQPFTNYWAENSYGRNMSQGKVFGWYRLNIDSDTYNYIFDTRLAEAAVKAADRDVDFNVYDWIVIIADSGRPNSIHHQGAISIRTGEGQKSLFFGYWGNPFPSIHELGHDLGLNHAGLLYCGNDQLKEDRTQCENEVFRRGDEFDPMGGGERTHLNAINKDKFGFFTASEVATVTQNGTFTLEPYELPESSLKVLKIMDPRPGRSTYPFWVEFRQPLLSDSHLPANILSGAMIRETSIQTGDGNFGITDSNIIDCTPVEGRGSDHFDVVCHPGQTMYDPGSKISITTKQLIPADRGNPAKLVVEVKYNGAPPPPSAVNITALSPNGGNPGTNITITGSGFHPTNNIVRFGQIWNSGIASTDGITLRFKIPSNATLGTHPVIVQNSNGVSNAVYFTVGTVQQTVSCPSPALTNDMELNSTDLSEGGQVTALQNFLWQYQYIYPKWGMSKLNKLEFVTGTYNKKTKTVVKKFQNQFKFLPKGSKEGGKVQAATRAGILAQCSQ